MRCLAAALLLVLASAARAQECVGSRTTVNQVIVTFSDCAPAVPVQVRWFDADGRYQANFMATADKPSAISPPFSPRVVMMSSAAGRGCVPGRYVVRDGRCMAQYDFPCAERSYVVTIATEPAANYLVHRAVAIPARRDLVCAQAFPSPAPVARFADDERVVIALYGAIDRNFPLVALPPIDLAAPPAGGAEVFDAARQSALIDKNLRGQNGAGLSPNAETIARQQKKNVLKTIKVTVEAVR